MDKHFLEFWGNFLINTAKEQRRMEDLSKWMGQGFKGSEDLTSMFKKFYGLERMSEDTPDYLKIWKKAVKDFQKSFKDYLGLMGVVPKDEHMKLVKEYEEIKKRVVDQEETIKHLRMLLDESWAADQTTVIKSFQDMIKEQSEKFQELTDSLGQLFNNKV